MAAVLEAVLERLTYVNDETGYTVAKVATGRSGSDLLTVVGALLGAQPGESLRLCGRAHELPRRMRGSHHQHRQLRRLRRCVHSTRGVPDG